MKAVLAAEIEDHLIITLDVTRDEAMEISEEDIKRLWSEIRRISCADQMADISPDVTKSVNEKCDVNESESSINFVCQGYKGISLESRRGSKESIIERLLDKVIEINEFTLPQSIQDEVNYVLSGTLQGMKYRNIFGGGEPEDIDIERVKAEVEEEVTRDYKVDLILKSIIEQENISVSTDELEAEAQALAKRDNTSIELVKKFMGEEYELLRGDILKKKARELIYESMM